MNDSLTVQTAVPTPKPALLRLPYEVRYRIYKMAGLIHDNSIPIIGNRCLPIDGVIPNQLFYTSWDVSNDALSMFWAGNRFRTSINCYSPILQVDTPIMWRSLRNLNLSVGLFHIGSSPQIDKWRSVCNNLGVHLPPSQLSLHLHIYDAERNLPILKDVLDSMFRLPILRRVYFIIETPFNKYLPIHQTACNLLQQLSVPTKNSRPFRFMDLPVEIQCQVLEYTDLVAPGAVATSKLKGFALLHCLEFEGPCSRRFVCRPWGMIDPWIPCSEALEYDSRGSCWSLPLNLFLVSKHLSMLSRFTFFTQNHFVAIISDPVVLFEGQIRSPLIWNPAHLMVPPLIGWHPLRSAFLHMFPVDCVPFLRSLEWRFPVYHDHINASAEMEADWEKTIDFIAREIEDLSRLTVTLDMSPKSELRGSPPRIRSSTEYKRLMVPVNNKLQGLRKLVVRTSLAGAYD
jgi:hypothetical protein